MQNQKIYFKNYKYNQCPANVLEELYRLRYRTFKERLDWDVSHSELAEFDEYDCDKTTYIIGESYNTIICAVRFICVAYPNMITGTFGDFFDIEKLEDKFFYIESSRFFVDKQKTVKLKIKNVTTLLFLEMFDYAICNRYTAILTIVSEPMLRILKRAGWDYDILQIAQYDKDERIYLLKLLLNEESKIKMLEKK